jgi:hypothetical protein
MPWQAWDLDHHDTDRRLYLGPSHASCNRRASMIRTNRRQAQARTPEARALAWARQYGEDAQRLAAERERAQPRTPMIYPPRI